MVCGIYMKNLHTSFDLSILITNEMKVSHPHPHPQDIRFGMANNIETIENLL
jgi:hypothetical protein